MNTEIINQVLDARPVYPAPKSWGLTLSMDDGTYYCNATVKENGFICYKLTYKLHYGHKLTISEWEEYLQNAVISCCIDAAIIETGVDDVAVLDSGYIEFGIYTATIVSHAQR